MKGVAMELEELKLADDTVYQSYPFCLFDTFICS
jgi:hypothetical protein